MQAGDKAMSDTPDLPPLPDWVEPLMPRATESAPELDRQSVDQAETSGAMPSIPPMQPIQSSNIAAAGHDGEALYVQFRNGGTYRYQTAGPELHAALLIAASPGAYFHQHIKSVHQGEKVA